MRAAGQRWPRGPELLSGSFYSPATVMPSIRTVGASMRGLCEMKRKTFPEELLVMNGIDELVRSN